jgi:hypothetical protein
VVAFTAILRASGRSAALWAETLFREALSLPDPAQRQRQVRDAALIGIMASLAAGLSGGSNLAAAGHVTSSAGAICRCR